jgi:hypothetical protein
MYRTNAFGVGVAAPVLAADTRHAAAVAAAGKHRIAAATDASVRPYVET